MEIESIWDEMIEIEGEEKKVEDGVWNEDENKIENEKNKERDKMEKEWKNKYKSEEEVLKGGDLDKKEKYWKKVRRVDNVGGERKIIW